MKYLGIKNDGLYSFANGEDIFIEHYIRNWEKIFKNLYYKTELLDYGHKIRPRLVYWGFCAGKSYASLNHNDYEAVSKIAISIELVHKASILLDDYIDGDTSRHGMDAFHITYGPERTMMFSLNVLCQALSIVNEVFIKYIDDSTYSQMGMKLIIKTLEEMSLGVLKELDLSDYVSAEQLENVKDIIYLETSVLITNSVLIGYLLSQNADPKNIKILEKIGNDLGYIFQILNDLEPFCSKKNNDHKGSLNTDVSRNRKNICIPILYSYINEIEKEEILNATLNCRDTILIGLFRKYNILDVIFDEINKYQNIIHKNIKKITNYSDKDNWCNDFSYFVDSIINVSKRRLE